MVYDFAMATISRMFNPTQNKSDACKHYTLALVAYQELLVNFLHILCLNSKHVLDYRFTVLQVQVAVLVELNSLLGSYYFFRFNMCYYWFLLPVTS